MTGRARPLDELRARALNAPELDGFEILTEAEAGINLSTGQRWWGTRVRYRRPPARRWSHLVLVDVHPFDDRAVRACVIEAVRS